MRFNRPVDPLSGITVVRLVMGAILFVAGLQKWLGGIGGTVAFFTQLGIPAPAIIGPVIATGELIGGLLLILGIGSRGVALWFVAEFLVTTLYVKLTRGAGWDAARIDLMLLAGSVMLVVGGAGKLAVDQWLAQRSEPAAGNHRAQVVSPR